MSFDPNNKNDKYYGNVFFDVNKRLQILKNNTNFILNDNDLEELVKKKCTFGNKRNLSFRQYIKAYYEDFKIKIEDEVKKLTSLDPNSDSLLIWANYTRVLESTIGLENILDDEEVSNIPLNTYSIDRFNSYDEIKEVLSNEYLMLDLETTGFNKLNQIIEFGGIIYNRKITKDISRIIEASYIVNEKLLLSLFKYFDNNYMINSGYDIFTEISNYGKERNNNEKFNIDEIEFIINKIDFQYSNLNQEQFKEKILKVTNYDFIYNKQIHFYIEHYKDYSNKMNESIHHIPNEKRTSVGKKAEDVLSALSKLLEGQIVLAHNALFDISKIAEFFNDFKYVGPNIKKVYDTINLFQVINKGMGIGDKVNLYNLDYLSKLYLGINLSSTEGESTQDRHTAIYDVKLTNRNVIKAKESIDKYLEDKNTPVINDLLKNIGKDKKEKIDKETKGLSEGQMGLF